MRVELLLVPACPHAAAARTVLADCLDQLGLDLAVHERTGDYPSPTVLVDGVDVMSGAVSSRGAAQAPAAGACRLDVPTAPRVLAALRGHQARPASPVRPRSRRDS